MLGPSTRVATAHSCTLQLEENGVQNKIHMKNRDKQITNYLSLVSSYTTFYPFGLVAFQGQ